MKILKSFNFWFFTEAMRCIVIVTEQYVPRRSPSLSSHDFLHQNLWKPQISSHRVGPASSLTSFMASKLSGPDHFRFENIILKEKNRYSFTRRAILILRVQLGPEFLRGNLWFNVISSASSRRVRGSVNVPNEQSCFSSFTWNIKCD